MIKKNSETTIQSVSQKLVTKNVNIHEHSFTCYKGPNGEIGCRLCKKSGLTSATGPVELDKASINELVPNVLKKISKPSPSFIGPLKKRWSSCCVGVKNKVNRTSS